MIEMAEARLSDSLADLFRENVRRILTSRGISRTILAARIGCSTAHITQMLKSDYQGLRLDTVEKWAEALEIDDPLELLKKEETQ